MSNVYVIYLGNHTFAGLAGLIVADSVKEAFDEYSRKCGFKDRLEFAKYYQGRLGWVSGIVEEGVPANQKTDIRFRVMTKEIKDNGEYKIVCKLGEYENRSDLNGLICIYQYIGLKTRPNDIDNQLMRATAEETKLRTATPIIVKSTVEEIRQREKYKQTNCTTTYHIAIAPNTSLYTTQIPTRYTIRKNRDSLRGTVSK